MDTKKWYESKSVWGSIVVVAAMAFNAFGYTVDESTKTQIVDLVTSAVALAGSAFAIYGRVKATKSIE